MLLKIFNIILLTILCNIQYNFFGVIQLSQLEKLSSSIITEYKKGTLTLAVLSQLKTPRYGYSLLRHLEERGILIEAGTLYPLLRRLEKQEILTSQWDTEEAKPRKYYVLSDLGLELYDVISKEWNELSNQIKELL